MLGCCISASPPSALRFAAEPAAKRPRLGAQSRRIGGLTASRPHCNLSPGPERPTGLSRVRSAAGITRGPYEIPTRSLRDPGDPALGRQGSALRRHQAQGGVARGGVAQGAHTRLHGCSMAASRHVGLQLLLYMVTAPLHMVTASAPLQHGRVTEHLEASLPPQRPQRAHLVRGESSRVSTSVSSSASMLQQRACRSRCCSECRRVGRSAHGLL